jgi:FkbH-like protein
MINNNISFLDATKILKEVKPKETKKIKLLTSFNTKQIELYLKAYARVKFFDLKLETIPFGTLRQHIINKNDSDKNSILVLTPADFSPKLDWRTGFPEESISVNDIKNEIEDFRNLVKKHNFKSIFLLPTSLPPLFEKSQEILSIELMIRDVSNDLNAYILSNNFFSLDSYLISGCPIAGKDLSLAAYHLLTNVFQNKADKKKIIVTDLDNTLWNGILGEDGVTGINALSEGNGFHHFIYQTYLKKLKESGVLLSICSKNDKDLVEKAFETNNFLLDLDDFVSVQASYNPKSLQIAELANTLNLGLESFVFIDDNPVEINEVKSSLPQVECLLFELDSKKYINMYRELSSMFINLNITKEDKNRTKLYRSMQKSIEIVEGESSDLSVFLKSLEMNVLISKKNTSNSERAIQLINKTNQFNLNGLRKDPDEINAIMQNGGHLFTASLSDIHGEHGEILSLLIDNDNVVQSFVLSCRVFQRKIEFLFLSILLEKYFKRVKLNYIETDRNLPIKLFLDSFKNIDLTKDIYLCQSDIDLAESNLFEIFSNESITITNNDI